MTIKRRYEILDQKGETTGTIDLHHDGKIKTAGTGVLATSAYVVDLGNPRRRLTTKDGEAWWLAARQLYNNAYSRAVEVDPPAIPRVTRETPYRLDDRRAVKKLTQTP